MGDVGDAVWQKKQRIIYFSNVHMLKTFGEHWVILIISSTVLLQNSIRKFIICLVYNMYNINSFSGATNLDPPETMENS